MIRRVRAHSIVSVFLTLLLTSAAIPRAAAAEDPRIEELERKVAALERAVAEMKSSGAAPSADLAEVERQIDVLTREIENLKLGEASPAAETGRHGLGPAASKVYEVKRGVSIGGYGEMVYENSDTKDESGAPVADRDTIDMLRFVLYAGYKWNDKILMNSEIEFEHASTGEGDEERGEVSVEFAYLDFLLREAANVRAGLVLVPVGFVNELHEPPVFLGSERPAVERAILPTTWREIGAGIFGDAGSISYRAYVVSSLAAVEGTSSNADGFAADGIREGRSGGSNAAAEDFALTGRLDWKPKPGILLGASFFTGDTGQGQSTPTGLPIDGRLTLWDAHAELRWRGLQSRALYARTTIGDAERINEAQGFTGADSIGEDQYGYYAEVGYDVLSHREKGSASLVPFVRWERYDTQDRVPAGFARNPANDVTLTTLGLVWKPIVNVAAKLDYSRVENGANTGVDQLHAALGFLF